MRNRFPGRALLLALAFVLAAGPAAAEVILLQRSDGEHGVGWLFRDRSGACRVATPRHVVQAPSGELTTPNAIDRYGRQFATANPLAPDDTEIDIAFLDVPGVLADAGCSLSRLSQVPLDSLLSTWAEGVLTIATQFDGQQTIRVERLVSTRDAGGGRTLAVAPLSSADVLHKGMSGGVIMTEGRAIAMLTDVEPALGVGIALRFDVIAAAFAALGSRSAAPQQAGGGNAIRDMAVLSGQVEPGATIGGFLSGAEALTLSAEHGGAILLTTTEDAVVASGVALRAGDQPLHLEKLIVEAASGSDAFALVRICNSVEATAEIRCAFAPRRMDRLKLSLVPFDGSRISLGGISLLTDPSR